MLKDLKIGKEGEELVKQTLEELGFECWLNEDKNELLYYDLEIKHPLLDAKLEIKNDLYATKSGNIAIEYYNCKSKKSSGISATKADYWVHIIDGNPVICSVNSLKEFIFNTKPYKNILAGGDNNANMYLYRIKDILPIFKPLKEILCMMN